MRSPALLAIVFSLLAASACEPVSDSFDYEREDVPVYKSAIPESTLQAPSQSRALRVMAYNIKYGACRIDFWFDYYGDRVQMRESEVLENMGRLEQLIREYNPDVLMAEEIEVGARRSAYVDMVQHILDHTALRYGAYFQTWSSRYIPSEGLGRMDLGNAIFSRFTIVKAERIRQPDRGDLSALEKRFYLHRAIGRTELQLDATRRVAAYVVHTEAYDADGTKQKQIKQIYDELQRETLPAFVGGDFNELPPGSVKTDNFNDEAASSEGTEFEQPPYTPDVMRPFFQNFIPAIPLADYGTTEASQSRYYSHSVIGPDKVGRLGERGTWTRTLDYLFAKSGTWEPGRSDVLQGPGRQGITSDPLVLSDHAPVVGTWVAP
jgi:endonuclease/exonuclease/phosphatase family metal-dependent hydrolase